MMGDDGGGCEGGGVGIGVVVVVVVVRARRGGGVQEEGVLLVLWSLDGEVGKGVCGFWGGVAGRRVGVGERGEEGRWKGEVRGEPKERGEGL